MIFATKQLQSPEIRIERMIMSFACPLYTAKVWLICRLRPQTPRPLGRPEELTNSNRKVSRKIRLLPPSPCRELNASICQPFVEGDVILALRMNDKRRSRHNIMMERQMNCQKYFRPVPLYWLNNGDSHNEP